jgi:2-amino-4-hydroxy-6-hydroxymethyldihydropteridine diphosphokinase
MIVASLYATEPVDCPPNTPLFINTVAALFPAMGMTAIELLEKMQDIESRFGRERSAQANQPRTLDLDLICFGNQQSAEAGLVLPHPRAHGRLFVLQPLAEIAPDLVLPGQLGSVQQLLSQLSAR